MAYLKYFIFILALDVLIMDISCSFQILKSSMDLKRLYIFGDSLFDAGNPQYLPNDTDYLAAKHFPYGFTYFTNPTGRYCDGRIVPDFLSGFAGLGLIPPSMEPGADFSNGANFAAYGACVLNTSSSSAETLNLGDQVNNFTYMVTNMKAMIGDVETKKILVEAVYLFGIGAIDYGTFSADYLDNGTSPTLAEQEAFVETVVGNISARLLEIYNLGGRKFAFQNVGPLGCIPTTLSLFPQLDGHCFELQLDLAKMHNKHLSATLNNMALNLAGFKYSIFDYYDSLFDRIKNPSKYGIINATSGCCGYIYDPYRGQGCAKENFIVCQYPSAYLFWDGSHTTQHTNHHVAQLIWSGRKPITGPYNMRQLFEECLVEIY